MRFRWAKFFYSRASRAALAGLIVLLAPVRAHALLSITSLQSTGQNDKFFFAGTATGGNLSDGANTAPAFPDPDSAYHFHILDYSKACPGGSCDINKGIEFVVTSDKTTFSNPAGSPMRVLVVHVFQSNGATTNQTFAPIAAVNGQQCDGSICATLGQDSGARGYFFGAIFSPGSQLTITLMPKDICGFAVAPSGSTGAAPAFTPSICDSAGSVLTTTPMQLFVKFSLIAVPDNQTIPPSATPITSAASLDDGPATTTLNFQSESPALADAQCVLDNVESVYFPGDGLINLETNRFAMTLNSGGDAPADSVVIVGKTGATAPDAYIGTLGNATTGAGATVAALNKSLYPLVERVPIQSGSRQVKGFVNSDSVTDANTYTLVFLVRDRAGLIAAPVSPTCTLTGVRTTAIQGFLREGKCFIATAAFRDYRHGPVAMLRRFRDHVLLKAAPGRAFVRWYYDWSPDAAEWLMEHPAFRYPVLLALLPLEVLAWLGLHPPILALLGLTALLLFATVVYLRFSAPLRRE